MERSATARLARRRDLFRVSRSASCGMMARSRIRPGPQFRPHSAENLIHQTVLPASDAGRIPVDASSPLGLAMADPLSREQRTEVMRRIGRENTPPEMAVRRSLHRMGYRYRLHGKDLPGRPDVILPRHRAVVFVHGCFWHGCEKCYRGTRVPKSNREYWLAKVQRNQERDLRSITLLEAAGWHVLVVWECQTHDLERLAELLLSFMSGRIGSRREKQ